LQFFVRPAILPQCLGSGILRRKVASFCRETPGLNSENPSYVDGLGTKFQERSASASSGRVIFGLGWVLLDEHSARDALSRGSSDPPGSGLHVVKQPFVCAATASSVVPRFS
jgi:hypothetical protein